MNTEQSAEEMKGVVPVAELVSALNHAGLAVTTEQGGGEDDSDSDPTIGFVRIAADDCGIRFESSVREFSSMWFLKVGGGVRVVQRGEVCVPAVALGRACSMFPQGREVSLAFVPATGDSMYGDPNGTVEIGLVEDCGATVSVRIESYPADQTTRVEYPDASDLSVMLRGKASAIKEPYELSRFATQLTVTFELFDKVFIRGTGHSISFASTDKRQCAIATRSRESFEQSAVIEVPLPLDAHYLTPVLEATLDDEDVMLATDSDEKHAYLYCGSARYRFKLPAAAIRAKYPDAGKLLTMRPPTVILADRKWLVMALGMASLVNEYCCTLSFSGRSLIGVGTKVLRANNGVEASVSCKLVSSSTQKVQSVDLPLQSLRNCVSRLKADSVRISFSCDMMNLRIEDEIDPQFTYFMQAFLPTPPQEEQNERLNMNETTDQTARTENPIMGPGHPSWAVFKGLLYTALRDEDCEGGTSLRLASQVLRTFEGIDVDGSLALFSERGGHCDCEVLLNVN